MIQKSSQPWTTLAGVPLKKNCGAVQVSGFPMSSVVE